jgi:hypothetical protein
MVPMPTTLSVRRLAEYAAPHGSVKGMRRTTPVVRLDVSEGGNMDARQGPGTAGDDEPMEASPSGDDAFAGLTPIDVVDGELVPRTPRRRR